MNKEIKEAKNRLNNLEERHNLLWMNLKEYFASAGSKYETFESEKYIETLYSIDESNRIFKRYHYFVDKESDLLKSVVWISEGYDDRKSRHVLILSAHFNSLMKHGIVRVNTNSCTVLLEFGVHLLVPFMFSGEIHSQIVAHYEMSKDIVWAFNRLFLFDEDPVFIILDLQKKIDKRVKDNQINNQKKD